MLIRWFLELPKHRKVVLILAGGMLTLVFDAFVPHFQWNRGSMKWNQWIPIVYGLGAFLALHVVALRQLSSSAENKILAACGVLGLLVGAGGVYYHLSEFISSMEGEELGLVSIGSALKLAPPVFAPAAFAGVGLLLLVVKRLTAAVPSAAHLPRVSDVTGKPASVVAMGSERT